MSITTTKQQTIADRLSDWSQTLAFAQFDGSQGTLDSLGVSLTGDVFGSFSIESLEAAPANVTVSLNGVISASSPTGVLLAQVSPAASASINLGAYDGNTNYGGSSGTVLSGISGTGTVQAVFQPGAGLDLGSVIGTGSIPVTVAASSRLEVTGPANLQIASHASAGAAVTLQYVYTPPQNGSSTAGAGLYDYFAIDDVGYPSTLLTSAGYVLLTTTPQSFSVADSTTGWTNSVPALQFNPSLGILEGVNLSLTGDIAGSVAAENENATAAQISTTQTATLTLDLPNGTTAASVAPSISDFMNLAGYDGTPNFAGTSGHIDQGLTQTADDAVTLTDVDLSPFIGSGTVALPLSAVGTSTLDGPGNLLARLLAQAGATVTVSYTYVPWTETPSATSLTLSTEDTWTNPTGGDWSASGDWSSNPAVPGASDDVEITQAGTYTITLTTAQAAQSVVLDAPGAVLILDASLSVTNGFTLEAGTLEFNGGTLLVGSYEQDGGLALGGTVDIVAAGSVALNAGSINGTDVTLTAGTSLTVGTAGGSLTGSSLISAGTVAPVGAYVTTTAATGVLLDSTELLETDGEIGGPIVTAVIVAPPITWTNAAGGDWGSATNWSSSPNAPGTDANVEIAASGNYVVSVNDSRAVDAVLLNALGTSLAINGTLSIGDTAAFDSGSVALDGTLAAGNPAAIVDNAVTLTTSVAFGTAVIDADFVNTGLVQVNYGTLSLNGGGSSNAFGLQAAASGVLRFGGLTGTIDQTFSLTGGMYQGLDTVISGSTLDASAASSVIFGTLQLAASGVLLLGSNLAQSNAGFTQGPTSLGGATGSPVLSGSNVFTVFGGADLSAGEEAGTGTTRLFGVSVIGGSAGFLIDDGRTVENDGWLNWSSGNITLGNAFYPVYPLATGGVLYNAAGATFYITASGGRIANGLGGAVENAGIMAAYAGSGGVGIADTVNNTGYIQVQSGLLALDAGGSSDASHLYVAPGAELLFGLADGPPGLPITPGTFTLTGGNLTVSMLVVSGTTLDASAASGVNVGVLDLTAAGVLLLGAGNAQTSGAFSQGPTAYLNATGTPLLSGSGTFTVFGGASLTNGVETGTGTTRLFDVSSIGGTPAFEVDGGRTVENDGWLNWSSGDITLGAGDASAVTHSGTLTNTAGATFFITAAGGRINNATGGVLNNAGVMAVYAGGGDEVDVDAAVNNTGYIQVQSGTLSLNGGGTSDAGHMVVASGAVLQFGTAAGGAGGTFSFTGGVYAAGTTQITGGTVDLAAASGAVFGSSLAISGGGVLRLGGLYTGADTFGLGTGATSGTLSGSGNFTVTGIAELGNGVLTGGGVIVLGGFASLNGALQLDGGRVLQNDGALTWSNGSIALGSGDAGAVDQAGYFNNVTGATIQIESDGTITSPGAGAVFNAGTIVKLGGSGTTSVQALLDSTGTVAVESGTLSFTQSVIGAGTFDIDGTAKLDFASVVDSNARIAFIGGGGTLTIDSGGFGAAVTGFTGSDVIDLTTVRFALTPVLNFTQGVGGGTLSISDAAHSVAFSMLGTFTPSGFQLFNDGHGGTAISY